jgi:hypothetical protein
LTSAIGTSARWRRFAVVAQLRIVVTQQFADPRAGLRPDLWPQRHEGIERGRREHAERPDIKPAVLFEFPEIEHVIANRDANARGEAVPGGEYAVREVLDREVGDGID